MRWLSVEGVYLYLFPSEMGVVLACLWLEVLCTKMALSLIRALRGADGSS